MNCFFLKVQFHEISGFQFLQRFYSYIENFLDKAETIFSARPRSELRLCKIQKMYSKLSRRQILKNLNCANFQLICYIISWIYYNGRCILYCSVKQRKYKMSQHTLQSFKNYPFPWRGWESNTRGFILLISTWMTTWSCRQERLKSLRIIPFLGEAENRTPGALFD